jgi:hypothetical protein
MILLTLYLYYYIQKINQSIFMREIKNWISSLPLRLKTSPRTRAESLPTPIDSPQSPPVESFIESYKSLPSSFSRPNSRNASRHISWIEGDTSREALPSSPLESNSREELILKKDEEKATTRIEKHHSLGRNGSRKPRVNSMCRAAARTPLLLLQQSERDIFLNALGVTRCDSEGGEGGENTIFTLQDAEKSSVFSEVNDMKRVLEFSGN